MNDEITDIAEKLQKYDEAFDFYMDRGQLPDSIPPGDLLGGVIRQTVQDNPQLDSQDPLWIEILKEELMRFIEAMLKLFQPIEENYRREKALITTFAASETNWKRKLWGQVYRTIKFEYKPYEVNIDGYVELMKNENLNDVFASMIKDWDKACDQRVERLKELAIRRNEKTWEHHVKEWGLADYEQRKKIERLVYSYPALAEIVRIMGREEPKRDDEMDDTIKRYLPLLPSPPKPAVEIDEVSNGNDLKHVLPVEMAIMADPQTEDFFYLKYATKKLRLFANKPKLESQMKVEQTKKKKPRLEKGPIIVSLDTSGSMEGDPIKLAKSLLMRKVSSFLDSTFTGGTDGEQMLNAALKMLQTSNFSMADVLIISDFYFSNPSKVTRDKMTKEQNKGTKFYGLNIDGSKNNYYDILDRIWKVQIRSSRRSFG